MVGLQAISAHNGWAMAVTGAIIVMCGLSILAFIISQLHKIIGFFEKKNTISPETTAQLADIKNIKDLATAALIYQQITAELGEKFQLPALYDLFEREKLPHPHITITALRNDGHLVPLGEGYFCWSDL